jgi:uncharacterized membrane protein
VTEWLIRISNSALVQYALYSIQSNFYNMKRRIPRIIHWFNNFRAIHKLLFSVAAAVIVCLILIVTRFEILTGVMVGWDIFSICLIGLSWLTFFVTDAKELCLKAKQQDESRYAIFLIVLLAVCISIVGILIVLKNTDENLVRKELHTIVSMLGVALSWFLLHTTLTLRYAHLFYVHTFSQQHQHKGGINFPEEIDEPDYLDFAYFSFVIGMTFQVSDVQVTSQSMRRVVLLHGLISFVFNTIIVALTINTIANISK